MPEQSHIFEVEMPDGQIIEVEAPAATEINLIKQRANQHWQTTQRQANYQSPVYPQGESSRTPAQVMQDQAANVLRGIPQAITGIPAAIGAVGGAVWDMATGQGSARGQELVKGAAAGMAAPFKPIAKSVIGQAPSPESPEWAEAAQGAGAMLGSAELPNALQGAGRGMKGVARAALRQVTTPESMAARAAANKAVALKPVTLEHQGAAQRITPELSQRRMGKGIRGTTIDRNLQMDNANAAKWVRAAEARLSNSAVPEHQVSKMDLAGEVQAAHNAISPNLFPQARSALKRVMNEINTLPEQAGVKELIKLRRNLDEVADQMGAFRDTGLAADKITASTFRSAADMVRRRLNNMDDSLRLANHEYWLTRKAVDIGSRRELGEVGKVGMSLPGRGALLDDLVALGIGGSVGGPGGAMVAEGVNLARQSRGFANIKSGVQQGIADFIERPQPQPAGLLGTGSPRMGPPPSESFARGVAGTQAPATREIRTGRLLGPAPTEVPMGEPMQRFTPGSTEPKVMPLPMRKTGLDYGGGRYSDEMQNFQYSGEMEPGLLSRPEGPGVMMTKDPKVKAQIEALKRILAKRKSKNSAK